MKKLYALLLTLFVISPAYAGTDYKCVNDCTSKGYQYQYCLELCSYNTTPQVPQRSTPRIDYKCVNDCTQKGYQYQYCVQQCSY